jgi:hypothetical protein
MDLKLVAALLTVAQSILYLKNSRQYPNQPDIEILKTWFDHWVKYVPYREK